MTVLIILLNIVLAVIVVAGMVALHASAIVAEHRANHAGTGPSLGIMRARPRVRVPSVRWTRRFDPATD